VALALCYTIVLQAFFAGWGLALAVNAADTGTVAVVCPGGGGNPPAGPDDRTPASDSCVLCATCTSASAGGLAASTTLIVAEPSTASRRIGPFDIAVLAKVPPTRAWFARAPPNFA